MTHPEDLLAEYVDGTLPDKQRAVVDSHLSSCETCREEIALASTATEALASLPDEPVPLGVTGPVLAEARVSAQRRRPSSSRLQWAVGLAAAASFLLVAVLVTPRILGGSSGGEAATARSAASGGAGAIEAAPVPSAKLPALEKIDRNLSDEDVRKLALDAVAGASASDQSSTSGFAAERAVQPAIDCLRQSGAPFDEQDVLVRAIETRYLGTPAYVGVFLQGPGAGQPADHAVVWIVSKQDCSILTMAQQPIH
jgi:anti-sigma factor RsiW